MEVERVVEGVEIEQLESDRMEISLMTGKDFSTNDVLALAVQIGGYDNMAMFLSWIKCMSIHADTFYSKYFVNAQAGIDDLLNNRMKPGLMFFEEVDIKDFVRPNLLTQEAADWLTEYYDRGVGGEEMSLFKKGGIRARIKGAIKVLLTKVVDR